MKRIIATLALALYSLTGHAAQINIPGSTHPAAEIILPEGDLGTEALPLVVLLHGYAGNSTLIDAYMGLSDQVNGRRFILLVPDGLEDKSGFRYWNATSGCCDFDHTGNDDVAYILALVAKVKKRHAVDSQRIYLAGHSNGGFMSHRLACEPGNPFAAIASFAGATTLNPAECRSTRPISVLQIHALDDDTIHYGGDPVGYPKLAPYPGVSESVGRWAKRDGCAEPATAGEPLDLTLSIPGVDTDVKRWSGCANQTQVQLWTIHAHESYLHKPHTPLLREEFTTRVLDFLLSKKKS